MFAIATAKILTIEEKLIRRGCYFAVGKGHGRSFVPGPAAEALRNRNPATQTAPTRARAIKKRKYPAELPG
jgi:hypothetical protein